MAGWSGDRPAAPRTRSGTRWGTRWGTAPAIGANGFQREVAATRALDPAPGFEALLRAWCGYLAEILPVARALEAAYITGDEGGDAWRDRMTELHEAFRLALERIAAKGRLAPGWTGETAADWAWARVQPGSWAALVGMRGWDPREYIERTVGSLLAELVTASGQLPISARSRHQVFTRKSERTAEYSRERPWPT